MTAGIAVLDDDAIEKLRAAYELTTIGNWWVDGSNPTGFATLIGAVPGLLARIDSDREEMARLRELYQDEHDWATAMFGVVEAARYFCAMAPPWGHAEGPERLEKLRRALAAHEGLR
jgi:hypothetical protein